jgi:hypothetical protein
MIAGITGYVMVWTRKHVWEALKIRAGRVVKRCLDNWHNVLTAFRDGAISGIISNLMTALINTFFTTARNLARMIREGLFRCSAQPKPY